MAATASSDRLAGVLTQIDDAFSTYRAERAELEADFLALVERLGERKLGGGQEEDSAVKTATLPATPAVAERLDQLDLAVSAHGVELSGRQQQLADEMGQLRELVNQQLDLLNSLAAVAPTGSKGRRRKSRRGRTVANSEPAAVETPQAQHGKRHR